MIIDIHGHIVAPPELFAYRSVLLASRGAHGKGNAGISDERLEEAMQGHIKMLDGVGTDLQFISPRPFQSMHSEKPKKVVRWWIETINDTIARECAAHPEKYRGVCGLPQYSGDSPASCAEELDRCINELGMIGCLLNPDPYEGDGITPTLGEEHWYPIYEKLVELDVPALVHSTACKNPRETYSNHFITEESIAILSLANSRVFDDFPTLKLIISHGGGSVPYQIGRWRAGRFRGKAKETFDESLRKLYFDTVLYNKESLELLFKIVGPERCMFGTEKPGVGTSQDPATGKFLDDLKPVIENIEWLTDEQRTMIFSQNAQNVFSRLNVEASVAAK